MTLTPAPAHQGRSRFFLFVALLPILWLVDRSSKYWVENYLQPRREIEVIHGFFNLTYVRNTGIAFGMFGGNNLLFAVLALGLMLVGLSVAVKLDWRRWETNIVAALLLSGALGNLYDRVAQGYVTDFLDFNLGFYRWPSFNFADSCITISVVWIVSRTLFARSAVSTKEPG